jgi:hypothetical protein
MLKLPKLSNPFNVCFGREADLFKPEPKDSKKSSSYDGSNSSSRRFGISGLASRSKSSSNTYSSAPRSNSSLSKHGSNDSMKTTTTTRVFGAPFRDGIVQRMISSVTSGRSGSDANSNRSRGDQKSPQSNRDTYAADTFIEFQTSVGRSKTPSLPASDEPEADAPLATYQPDTAVQAFRDGIAADLARAARHKAAAENGQGDQPRSYEKPPALTAQSLAQLEKQTQTQTQTQTDRHTQGIFPKNEFTQFFDANNAKTALNPLPTNKGLLKNYKSTNTVYSEATPVLLLPRVPGFTGVSVDDRDLTLAVKTVVTENDGDVALDDVPQLLPTLNARTAANLNAFMSRHKF